MTVGGTQGTTAVQEARRLDVPFLPLSKFAEEGAWLGARQGLRSVRLAS
jgi:hypothetical protein